MRIEIVSVGTEILLGQIVDTNSAFIADRCAEHGLDVHYVTTVGDNPSRLSNVLAIAARRCDAVIVTGGLGPTPDDLTRDAIAGVTGRPLEQDPQVAERIIAIFRSMNADMPMSNLVQADVPRGAAAIEQVRGTAPGLIVDCELESGSRAVIYALPGVPHEMHEMFDRAVLADLAERSGGRMTIRSRIVRCWGASESRISELLAEHYHDLDVSRHATIAFLASRGVIGVQITAKAVGQKAVDDILDSEERIVRDIVGDIAFGTDGDTLESVVVGALDRSGETLAAAESMTGGMFGETITRVPGSSAVFRGTAVTYSADAKCSILGVPATTIERYGVVSEAVAVAMSEGARRLFESDVAISVTGSAGPTTQGSKVGEAYIALTDQSGTSARHALLPGDRERVRRFATNSMLDMVRRRIHETSNDD